MIAQEMAKLNRCLGIYAREIKGKTLDEDGQEVSARGFAISVGHCRETCVRWITAERTRKAAWGECLAWYEARALERYN